MNYVLYVIGAAAIALACVLLLSLMAGRLDGAVASTSVVSMTASFVAGIGLCALGSAIGLLKQIARNTARDV